MSVPLLAPTMTGLIGLGLGFAASYPVAFLQEKARDRARRSNERAAARRQRRLDEEAARVEAARRAAEAEEREAEAKRAQERIEMLRRQRVGAQFLRRHSATDVGYGLVITALDAVSPETKVLVRAIANPEREPTPHDQSTEWDVGMEWRTLTKSEEEQRHLTTRLIAMSDNDRDGWVEFERLSDAGNILGSKRSVGALPTERNTNARREQ